MVALTTADGTKTYRCRLYRVADGFSDDSPGVFAEVWDTLETPEIVGLPAGEPEKMVVHESRQLVRRAIRAFRHEKGIVSVGSWNARGSF